MNLHSRRTIHLNPVRARMVDRPSAYPWSSHHNYAGDRTDAWITTDFALSMFHAERSAAIGAYARFVNDALAHPSVPSPFIERNPTDRRILGSDDFAARVLGDSWHPRSRKTLQQLIEEACLQFAVPEAALLSPSAQRHLTKARAWIAHQAITLRISSLSAVARHFNRSEAALRQSIKLHFNYP